MHPGRRARPRPAGAAGASSTSLQRADRRGVVVHTPDADRARGAARRPGRAARRRPAGRPRATTRPSSTPLLVGAGVRVHRARARAPHAWRRSCSRPPAPSSDRVGARTRRDRRRAAQAVPPAAHLGDDRGCSTRCRRWSRCCSRSPTSAPRPGEGPAFLSAVLANGTLFPLAALAIVLPLFLPVAVAVVGRRRDRRRGAAAARCATCWSARSAAPGCWSPSWSSVMAFVLVAVRGRRGDGVRRRDAAVRAGARLDRRRSSPALSGQRADPAAAGRPDLLAIGYVALSMLGVAAIALFLSTLTDSPLRRRAGRAGVAGRQPRCCSPSTPPRSIAPLPADPLLAGVRRPVPRPDPLARHRPRRRSCRRRTSWCSSALAWANFTTKDITS